MLWGRYRLFQQKRVKQWRHQGRYKRRARCTLHTGKLCLILNAINIYYVIARELNLSSVTVLRKRVCSLFIPLKCAQLCMLTQEKSTKLWELHILRNRIVVGSVKSLNQGLWLHIRIHFTPLIISKRIKEILTQKHQYDAKYLSRFNDKNAFRK